MLLFCQAILPEQFRHTRSLVVYLCSHNSNRDGQSEPTSHICQVTCPALCQWVVLQEAHTLWLQVDTGYHSCGNCYRYLHSNRLHATATLSWECPALHSSSGWLVGQQCRHISSGGLCYRSGAKHCRCRCCRRHCNLLAAAAGSETAGKAHT